MSTETATAEAGDTDVETPDTENVAAADVVEADVAAEEGPDSGGDPGDTSEKVTTTRSWPRRVAWAAVGFVVVASLACAAVATWMLRDARAIDSAADEARAAARNYAVTLTSVDSDDLDQNFTDVLDGATGEFKDMYAQSSEQLRQLLVDNNASASGTVVEDGVKSATRDRVEVLLFVDQTVTNSVTPDPRMDRSRIVMTMEKVDGRWLASKVDLP